MNCALADDDGTLVAERNTGCVVIEGRRIEAWRAQRREMGGPWESWLDGALLSLEDAMLLRSLRPVFLSETEATHDQLALATFEGLGPWDRAGVAVEVSEATVDTWLRASTSTGEQGVVGGRVRDGFCDEFAAWCLRSLLLITC